MNVTRRTLIAALLGGGATTLAARYWAAAVVGSLLSLKLPQAGAADSPSFEVFLALSCLVTVRPKLDEAVARRMYPLFLEEPWGAHHIHSTYSQLLLILEQHADQPGAKPISSGALGKGQAWFAGHLLTTWYLGVYYHERIPPMRVAHAEALMFDVVHPELPRRFVEGTGFGGWADPPPVRGRS
jgi:hypothetical protein